MTTMEPLHKKKKQRSHQRYVLRCYHLIREIIGIGDINIERVSTEDNLADPLTKVLSQQKHDLDLEGFGIRYKGYWL
ncbi:Uncharacterized protein TCM_018230 [Theobroma cacao]|uniref:Uncharacterized protein n=1 Tax=Theobroma cacao TaxID=3641 RepID=A0A061EFB5_THECC|nr:Uncharacterized protein TCM_018230 [Theobroma cacao]